MEVLTRGDKWQGEKYREVEIKIATRLKATAIFRPIGKLEEGIQSDSDILSRVELEKPMVRVDWEWEGREGARGGRTQMDQLIGEKQMTADELLAWSSFVVLRRPFVLFHQKMRHDCSQQPSITVPETAAPPPRILIILVLFLIFLPLSSFAFFLVFHIFKLFLFSSSPLFHLCYSCTGVLPYKTIWGWDFGSASIHFGLGCTNFYAFITGTVHLGG